MIFIYLPQASSNDGNDSNKDKDCMSWRIVRGVVATVGWRGVLLAVGAAVVVWDNHSGLSGRCSKKTICYIVDGIGQRGFCIEEAVR